MGERAPWPKALEPWEPELRLLARDLVGHLAPLAERVANLLGPLRLATEQRADEPNGYSALSRRGPYDRLVASEWALQLEDPDEFIRRASSGEHLFVELERRSPASALEAWLLLDSGPGQLGAPRIAQLATLVAFARRARTAGVELRWAPVRNWEQPAHRALDSASVHDWLESRTPWVPTSGMLEQWPRVWGDDDVVRDVWLVGSPETGALGAARGWGTVVIDDGGEGELELRVTPPGKSRARALKLTLPPAPLQVRLLRDPFGWARQPVAPSSPKGTAIALEPKTELAFSHDSHRLLARTTDGSVAALPVRNTSRATYGWPAVAVLPPRTRLVAASWASRRARGTVVEREDGSIHGADWDGRLLDRIAARTRAPLPHELPLATWPLRQTWQDERRLMDDGFLAEQVHGGFVVGLHEGTQLEVYLEPFRRWLTVSERPEAAWVCWGPNGPIAVCLYSHRVDVVLGNERPVRVRTLPRTVFALDRIVGVRQSDKVTIFAVHQDRRSIRALPAAQVAPQWREEVRARAPIETTALSPNGALLAWRDLNGELGVYSISRAETVLRVHVRDARVALP